MSYSTLAIALIAAAFIFTPSISAIAMKRIDAVCITSIQLPVEFACATGTITSGVPECDADSCTVMLTSEVTVKGPGCGRVESPLAQACAKPDDMEPVGTGSDPYEFARESEMRIHTVTTRLAVALEPTFTYYVWKPLEHDVVIPAKDPSFSL